MNQVSTSDRGKLANANSDMRGWGAVLLTSVFVLLVTSLPYAFAALTVSSDKEFMGIIYNVHDNGAYRSWTRQAGEGLLIRDQLTVEPNDPVVFNPLWLILGKIEIGLELPFPVGSKSNVG